MIYGNHLLIEDKKLDSLSFEFPRKKKKAHGYLLLCLLQEVWTLEIPVSPSFTANFSNCFCSFWQLGCLFIPYRSMVKLNYMNHSHLPHFINLV